MKSDKNVNMSIMAHRFVEWLKQHYTDLEIYLDVDEVAEDVARYEEFQEFPEELRNIVVADISRWAEELQTAEMVRCYGEHDDPFLVTYKWPRLGRFYPHIEQKMRKQILVDCKAKAMPVCLSDAPQRCQSSVS